MLFRLKREMNSYTKNLVNFAFLVFLAHLDGKNFFLKNQTIISTILKL